MKARLIYREKYVYSDGAIREMVLWQLPKKEAEVGFKLKYRLYYGSPAGSCIIRYDNETGKGDHRHIKGEEKSYNFVNIEKLVADFLDDIEKARRGKL